MTPAGGKASLRPHSAKHEEARVAARGKQPPRMQADTHHKRSDLFYN